MLPLSNLSFTLLCIALVLVLADAPMLPIYIVLGLCGLWQFLVTFATPGVPTPEDDDVPRNA